MQRTIRESPSLTRGSWFDSSFREGRGHRVPCTRGSFQTRWHDVNRELLGLFLTLKFTELRLMWTINGVLGLRAECWKLHGQCPALAPLTPGRNRVPFFNRLTVIIYGFTTRELRYRMTNSKDEYTWNCDYIQWLVKDIELIRDINLRGLQLILKSVLGECLRSRLAMYYQRVSIVVIWHLTNWVPHFAVPYSYSPPQWPHFSKGPVHLRVKLHLGW